MSDKDRTSREKKAAYRELEIFCENLSNFFIHNEKDGIVRAEKELFQLCDNIRRICAILNVIHHGSYSALGFSDNANVLSYFFSYKIGFLSSSIQSNRYLRRVFILKLEDSLVLSLVTFAIRNQIVGCMPLQNERQVQLEAQLGCARLIFVGYYLAVFNRNLKNIKKLKEETISKVEVEIETALLNNFNKIVQEFLGKAQPGVVVVPSKDTFKDLKSLSSAARETIERVEVMLKNDRKRGIRSKIKNLTVCISRWWKSF